jgi:hypothetical protein
MGLHDLLQGELYLYLYQAQLYIYILYRYIFYSSIIFVIIYNVFCECETQSLMRECNQRTFQNKAPRKILGPKMGMKHDN